MRDGGEGVTANGGGAVSASVSVCVGPGVHLVFVEQEDGADLGEAGLRNATYQS